MLESIARPVKTSDAEMVTVTLRSAETRVRFRAEARSPLTLCTLAALLLVVFSLSGCGQFFANTTTTTSTTGTTTTTGDYLYVANANTALDTVAGFSLASAALTTTASSPYQVPVVPTTLAITPSNSILFAGSELGGVYAYLVGSSGQLTLGTGTAASASPTSMIVDTTGQYLLVLESGGTSPVLSAYPFNASSGSFSNATSSITLDAGTSGTLIQVPNSTLIYASLGTGGVDALTFDSSTGVLTKLNVLLSSLDSGAYSDNGLAADPTGKFLFVTETGTNGIRSFTINTDGTLTSLGSPTTAGLGIGAVIVDRTGAFVYALNSSDNTISAFALSTAGVLTEVNGSPFATGSHPISLAEDSSKGYLAVACSNGSPDLELFTIAATGALTSALNQSTGSTTPAGAAVVVASN